MAMMLTQTEIVSFLLLTGQIIYIQYHFSLFELFVHMVFYANFDILLVLFQWSVHIIRFSRYLICNYQFLHK